MAISSFVFWLIALMMASSALVVVSARNILHAAFALCITFLGVGAMYVFLHADFVAAVQLIVYVGGILVLIMFAVMFSSNVAEDTSAERRGRFAMGTGAIAALAVFVAILMMVRKLEAPLAEQNKYAQVDYANTVGVLPQTLSENQLKLATAHRDVLVAVKTMNDETANAEILKRVPGEDGPKLVDVWAQFKGHFGIGHKLVGEFILPFEVVSVLLLAALVGAVVIVRKELN